MSYQSHQDGLDIAKRVFWGLIIALIVGTLLRSLGGHA